MKNSNRNRRLMEAGKLTPQGKRPRNEAKAPVSKYAAKVGAYVRGAAQPRGDQSQ